MMSFNDLREKPSYISFSFTAIPITKATAEGRISRFSDATIAYSKKVAKKKLSADVTVKPILSPSPSLQRQQALDQKEHSEEPLEEAKL